MELPEISIEARLIIYRKVYQQYIQFIHSNWNGTLCHRIQVIAKGMGIDYPRPGMLIERLPELMKYKPDGVRTFSNWWPVDDTGTRIKVMRRVIKITMKKIEKNEN